MVSRGGAARGADQCHLFADGWESGRLRLQRRNHQRYGSATSAVSTLTVIAQLTDAYATNLLSLLPVGYWPLQETSAPAPANMETNYGTLGQLGNAYYAATDAATVAFGQPGALAGDTDASVSLQRQRCQSKQLCVCSPRFAGVDDSGPVHS